MENRSTVLKGVILVAIGASSYGMLATFVKLAYKDTGVTGLPFTLTEVVIAQFVLGLLGTALINAFTPKKPDAAILSRKDKFQLWLAGISTGLTSLLYYFAVQFIDVSIAIVLLMQTVWMAVLLEAILDKKRPSGIKLAAVGIVLIGTLLATGINTNTELPDWRGLVFGLGAAMSFTTTMYAANRIARFAPAGKRSFIMLCGGATAILVYVLFNWRAEFNYDIFYSWGLLLALFGTVLPPLFLNAGFPKAGIGLGSIVSAMELPVSVCFAWIFLNEYISGLRWFGIAIILAAIVLMNINFGKKPEN